MGTSLAGWANVFRDRDDFADLWFTTKNGSDRVAERVRLETIVDRPR
ncbi:hypothetical protein G7043_40505 [Lentzea sp. NEAU-D13]|uniref:Uncharacterized protein n=1 Tax=Lentzea alba TaxID=2714351 RepID=A0A7C9S102_9PSEU|nr:hypothetical protein [Lentzea alba]NGY65202.1 hypothetical protein [Lentzea alba]